MLLVARPHCRIWQMPITVFLPQENSGPSSGIFSKAVQPPLSNVEGLRQFRARFHQTPVEFFQSPSLRPQQKEAALCFLKEHVSAPEKLALFRCLLSNGFGSTARLLIDRDIVDLQMQDVWGRTILLLAAEEGNIDCVCAILNKAQEDLSMIQKGDKFGNTPLHAALKQGYWKCARLLILAGSSWDCPNHAQETPASLAFQGSLLLIKTLLDEGYKNFSNSFFLHYFALDPPMKKVIGHQEEMVEAMDSLSADLRLSCLRRALQSEDDEMALLMIEKGKILPTAQDSQSGKTALHIAAIQGSEAVLQATIELFQREGLSVSPQDFSSETPLHYACCLGDESKIRLLMKAGADLCKVDEAGRAPIALLIIGNFDLAKELIVKAQDQEGFDTELIYGIHSLLPLEKQEGLSRIIPFGQIIRNKQLAHIWGIKGQGRQGNNRFSYESMNWQEMAPLLFGLFERFLQETPLPFCYRKLACKVHAIGNSLDLSPEEIAQRVKKGQTVVKAILSHHHVSYLVLTKERLYFCNRGGINPLCTGVQGYRIRNLSRLAEAMQMIDSMRCTKELWEFMQGRLHGLLELEHLECLHQKGQQVGNCSATSLKSAFYALLYDEALRFHRSAEDAFYIAHGVYKWFTARARVESLREYQSGLSESDENLLEKIRAKIEDPRRLQAIFNGGAAARKALCDSMTNPSPKR